ncbi:hypothetical protein [Pseudoalteromonas aurantia]|uniref:Orphan lipoprotein n=1 Tax=Pseudoalteromonas aurantia 208 TaxID=1314867 RepID=A0ABR9EGF6_9GAMM|nr:hypothetical protein [Pseudoalteromonas aurantia]MBE0370077.1 hypothetical protein [Pseudoalteromonas aurantia 208]
MVKPLHCAFALVIGLTGCNTLSTAQTANIAKMTDCEKVIALVENAKDKFRPLKGSKVNTPFLTSWYAKYHLVGEQCQISEYSTGITGYHCETSFDALSVAKDTYTTSKSMLSKCLNESWGLITTTKSTIFTHPSEPLIVHLSVAETLNQHSPWQVKLEIMPDDE